MQHFAQVDILVHRQYSKITMSSLFYIQIINLLSNQLPCANLLILTPSKSAQYRLKSVEDSFPSRWCTNMFLYHITLARSAPALASPGSGRLYHPVIGLDTCGTIFRKRQTKSAVSKSSDWTRHAVKKYYKTCKHKLRFEQ